MTTTLFSRLRRARWVHALQLLVFTFWVMNPFPGALSYWTDGNGDRVKEEVANPPEGDSWWDQDSDGDNLTNAQEAVFGSDPYQIDADYDGLTDQVERDYADPSAPYDPWNWDSDGDGFSDHDEYYQRLTGWQPQVNYNNLTAGGFYSYSDADGDGTKNPEDGDLNFDRDGDGVVNWQDGTAYFNGVGGQWMDDTNNGAWIDPGVYIGGNWYPSGTVDSDSDGTPDHLDVFPWGSFWYNGSEYGGSWQDSDYDGIPDLADAWPWDANNGYTPPAENPSFWYNGTQYWGVWQDSDNDGIPDLADAWPNDASNGQFYYNGTLYSGGWNDADGDGIPDPADSWPNDPTNGQYYYYGILYFGGWVDSDNDGIPDPADSWPNDPNNGQFYYNGTWYSGSWSDRDGDNIPDVADTWPDDANNGQFYYNGNWYSGLWSDMDGDGIPDAADAWPNDANNGWFTYNGNWYSGGWSDSDNDGIPDAADAWPTDPNNGGFTYNGTWYWGSWSDSDSDGIPDVADGWPNDASNGNNNSGFDYNGTWYSGSWSDSDGDGIPDVADGWPYDYSNGSNYNYNPYYEYNGTTYSGSWSDIDGDGVPDPADSHSSDSARWTDFDNDSRNAADDSHPDNPYLWSDWNFDWHNNDTDGDEDGILDARDSHPRQSWLWADWNNDGSNDDPASDYDGDNHTSENDSHPGNGSLWSDWNYNGTNNDADGDEDGHVDDADSHPRDASLWSDWNGNGTNNDSDGDEDGYADAEDSHPQYSGLHSDWNGDGDDNDTDWDEDGVENSQDTHPRNNILSSDADGDGRNAAEDSNPQNNQLWSDWDQNGVNNDADGDEDGWIDGTDSHPHQQNLWSDFDGDNVNADHDSNPQDNTLWSDWNRDGDNNNDDWDEDGHANTDDSAPYVAMLWSDWDGNGVNNDQDGDEDGAVDALDSHPHDPTFWGDWNYDGTNDTPADNADGDVRDNTTDSDPRNPALWSDWNHDGTNNDADGDEDGFLNPDDSHPFEPALSTDWNRDGDNNPQDMDEDGHANEFNDIPGRDSHPRDPALWSDWDGNGVNNDDDGDEDGIADAVDSHPFHQSLWSDWDGNQINNDTDGDEDGIVDTQDSDPRNNALHSDWNHDGDDNDTDWDEDGHDNGNDSHPSNAVLWSDYDGDGHNTENDSDPQDGSLWSDWNHDGDNNATDGDEDGAVDASDSNPRNPNLWEDWNHDGYNDGDDLSDDDEDGIPNSHDRWRLDPENGADSDNDGLTNYEERINYGTNPYYVDTDGDGLTDSEELHSYNTDPLQEKTNPNQPYTDYYTVDQTDTDSDGIPDRIELWYFRIGYTIMGSDTADDARADFDGDGYTNLQAYHQGWSFIAHVDQYDNDGDRILDVIEDAWNAVYPGILSSSNFNDAVEDHDNDGLMNYEEIALGLNPGSPNSRSMNVIDMQEWAWRINMSGDATWQVLDDSNQDGVADGLMAFVAALNDGNTTVALPVRATSGDCDGDGMPDVWEYRYYLLLRDASDAGSNADGDSLTNLQEFQQNRNPLVYDDEPLLILTQSLPDGTQLGSYSATLSASGGAPWYVFSVVGGVLPDGLTLEAATGTISGTPVATGAQYFTVQLNDSQGHSVTRDLFIAINGGGGSGDDGGPPPPPALEITTTDKQLAATVGEPFTMTMTASGGPGGARHFDVSIIAPDVLPPGLEIAADGKTITGLPGAAGACRINVAVQDGTSTASKELVVTASNPLLFTTESVLPGIEINNLYLQQLEITGGYGDPTFTRVAGVLPNGIALTPHGYLTGISGTSGSYTFTVRATDEAGHIKDQEFMLYVNNPPPPLVITTLSLPPAITGEGYGASVGAAGGTGDGYAFAGGGPDWLMINADGSISGTPTLPGIYAIDVTVSDSSGRTASTNLNLIVRPARMPLVISGEYSASGGAGDYAWGIVWDPESDIPSGVHLEPAQGQDTELKRPPDSTDSDAETKTYWGYVMVADGDTNTASVPLTVTIKVSRHEEDEPDPEEEEKEAIRSGPTTDPDESHEVNTTDGAGSRYRKVGLNGLPLSDGKPQAKDESGEVAEETYIDAYSSELRHGVSDVYVSPDASLLPLTVRRDVTDDVWYSSGLQPRQRPDRPFGAGWTSNLCATVKIDSGGTHATVTDEQGSSHSFFYVDTGFGGYWRAAMDATGDVKARWNSLQYSGADHRSGGTFIYTKAFGTRCVYQYCVTRTNGDNNVGDLIQYFRLVEVTDRLQNKLVYQYPGQQDLIPGTISDPDRPGHVLSIAQDFEKHVVTRVIGPGGDITDYAYMTQQAEAGPHGQVDTLTGVTRQGTNGTAASTFQYGYSLVAQSGWHAAVDRITDELGRAYAFTYRENTLVKFVQVHNGIETIYNRNGMPRLISSVTLPDGGVTTFNTVRDATIRCNMVGELFSTTSVNGPAGATTYHFTSPSIYHTPPPPEDSGIIDMHPDTTLSFTRMQITTPAGAEVYTFNPGAGMALASATDVSGNTTTFQYAGGYDDPVREIDALGNFKDFTYEPTTRVMSSMRDQTGVVTSYQIQPHTGLKLSETVTGAGGVVEKHSTFEYGHPLYKGFMTKSTTDGSAADTAPPTVTTYELGGGVGGWRTVTESTQTASGMITTTTAKNGAGNKTTVTDPRGNTTSFAYDGHHRLIRVTQADSAHKDLAYDAHGNLIRETNENGTATIHEYDVMNRRIKTTVDLNGNGTPDAGYTTAPNVGGANVVYSGDIVTTTTYNIRGQVATQTDARGKVTTHTYDDAGRVLSTNDGGLTTTMAYGANSGGSVFDSSGFKPTQITDPRGLVSVMTYDKMYRTTAKTVSAGGITATTQTEYDEAGRPTKVTDPLGRVTLTVYDVFGQVQRVVHPDGKQVSTDYTHHGKPWKVVDEAGNLTRTDFDAAGRAIRTVAPAVDGVSPTTTTEYDAAGNAIRVTDPLGRVAETQYDNRNRAIQVKAPSVWDALAGASVQPTTQTTYDAMGQVLTVTDPQGNVSIKHYDRAGRNWKVVAPAVDGVSPVTVTKFDAGGLALSVTNPLGQSVTNAYDMHGRLVTTTDAAGITNTFAYDAAGNRTSVNDGLNQETTFVYDGFNRLVSQTFANGDTWTYTYNAVQKLSQTSPRGITTTYTYDNRDRVTATNAPGLARQHSYDIAGRLLSVTEAGNASANVAYTYDVLGRVLTETSRGITHSYTYDIGGNRLRADYGTGRSVQTTYDALNRPSTITEGGRVTSYGYDLGGRAVILKAGNGQTSRNTYDALGRLKERTLFRTPAMAENDVLASFAWTHDLLGNVTSQSETWSGEPTRPGTRTTSMAYDANNRLMQETINDPTAGVTTTVYAYDNANNRSSKQVTGGSEPGVWNYQYNSANQLTSWEKSLEGSPVKSAALTYDGAGNRLTQSINENGNAQSTLYAWDAQDRLNSVTMPDGKVHSYEYDYRTRRIGTAESTANALTGQTAIVFSGGLSLAEWESTTGTLPASPTVEYTRGPDMGGGVGGMLYSLRSGTAKYSLSNGRGDIVAQADQLATLTWTASYEAYGKRTKETGTNLDKQHANSKDEDPTGLLNEGFRYRDIETGVWLSRDPAGFVDGPNLYAYVMQNPWTAWDPDGLASATRMWDHLIRGEFKEAAKEAPLLGPTTSINDVKGLFSLPGAISQSAKKTAAIADKQSVGAAVGHVAGELTGANKFAEGVLGTEIKVDGKGNLVENKLSTRESIVRTLEGAENILGFALAPKFAKGSAPAATNPPLALPAPPKPRVPLARTGGPTMDPVGHFEVGQFIATPHGLLPVPKGGSWSVRQNLTDIHSYYPNGSNAYRLNPSGHPPGNPAPHMHLHLPGAGPGVRPPMQGSSLDVQGNTVPFNSAAAHWPL